MEGNKKSLSQLFNGDETRFIIPVYQRNYDWKKAHCKQLFDDLVQLIENNEPAHFFGSIVSVTQLQQGQILIIDGQQRITTVSLLLLALYKLLKSNLVSTSNRELERRICNGYLFDSVTNECKLVSVKDDRQAYEKLCSQNEDYDESSNMTSNYKYFCQRILQDQIDPDKIHKAISRLEVVSISLDPRYDNPQKIFESLNSTGLGLTEADKIRNFILMGITDANTQNQYYEKYWYKIKKITGDNVTNFIRDYLTIKLRRIPSFPQLYVTFKDFVKSSQQALDNILDEILNYVQLHQKIHTANTGCSKVDTVLKRLNLLDVNTPNPYLLELLNYCKCRKISDEDVAEILKVIETYLFRRTICEVPTNALNKIFSTLHRDALKIISTNNRLDNDDYVEVIKYILLSKPSSSSARFPDNKEFESKIRQRNFYSLNPKNRMYLFERLENGDSVESSHGAIAQKMENRILTVEHIMPQKLSKKWIEQLGSEYLTIHKTWLNKIANLTITGYNPEYSNKTFLEKRDGINGINGFKQSPIRLNKFMAKCDEWNEETLKARENELIKKYFLKLWKLPVTSYNPPTPDSDIHSLDEIDDFYTSSNLVAYSINGDRKEAKKWTDMFRGVLKYLYQEDPATITQMAMQSEQCFMPEPQCRRGRNTYFEIATGVYASTNYDTAAKIRFLKNLFPLFNMDGSEIEVEIGNEQSNE